LINGGQFFPFHPDSSKASREVKSVVPVLAPMLSSSNQAARLNALRELAEVTQQTTTDDDIYIFVLAGSGLLRCAAYGTPEERGPALMSVHQLSIADPNKVKLAQTVDFIEFLVRHTATSGSEVTGGILNNICTNKDARALVMDQPDAVKVLHKIATQGLPTNQKLKGSWVSLKS
jgi:hypothetical protein